MDRKIKVLALISIILAATFVTTLALTLQSTAKADANSTVATDLQPTLSSVNETSAGGFMINGFMGLGDQRGMGRGGGFGGPCGPNGLGRFGEFGAIQVSSDFTQNVTNIASNDSDVQNLFNQGFNITSVRPIISTTIDGNGNVVTKATTADITMLSATGRALVVVDLNQAKVTKIVTITMTEINK
jgi:hypothetical protein